MHKVLRPLALVAAASLVSTMWAKATFGGVETIHRDDLKAHLEFISHDLLEGRFTPSRGLDIAALYITTQLKLWGVKPGGTQGYLQPFPVRTREGQASSSNIVAIIEGTDAKLKQEFVVVSAHYDHIGTRNSGDDRIYNGADDNGSGTVALLEMAQALSVGPKPKRSIMLVWFAGEERGLWGAEHMASNPIIPLDRIAALLNIDMIGRSWTPEMGEQYKSVVSPQDGIFVIGSRLMSSKLGEISDRVNNDYLRLKFDFKFDDPNDPNRLFYRSDQYSFAKRGVPAIFYFDGLHPDYHQVQDEVETIDFVKMEMVTKTIFATAWTIAMEKEKPKVDRVLDR